jgi:hypothetical protein
VERDTTPEAARIQADVQRRLGGTPNGTSTSCALH